MRWPLQPLQPLQQTQLQPPFGQSVASLCHPRFTTTNLSYRFPILKLPPPPCAVLLVHLRIFTFRPGCHSSFLLVLSSPRSIENKQTGADGSVQVGPVRCAKKASCPSVTSSLKKLAQNATASFSNGHDLIVWRCLEIMTSNKTSILIFGTGAHSTKTSPFNRRIWKHTIHRNLRPFVFWPGEGFPLLDSQLNRW